MGDLPWGRVEFYWGLLLCGLLVLLVCARDQWAAHETQQAPPRRDWRAPACVGLALVVVALAMGLWARREQYPTMVFASRNFYGVLRMFEERKAKPKEHVLGLMHGRVWHGWQFVDPEQARWPTL